MSSFQVTGDSEKRPLTGAILLFCAFVQAAYLLQCSVALGVDWVLMLGCTVLTAAAGIARLTGDLRPLWLLLGILLLGAGIALLAAYSIPKAFKEERARTWPQANCTIVFSAVIKKSPEVRYQYTVGDRVFESEVVDFLLAPGNADREPDAIVRQYPSNSVGVCFVNPRNPAEATLERG